MTDAPSLELNLLAHYAGHRAAQMVDAACDALRDTWRRSAQAEIEAVRRWVDGREMLRVEGER